MSPIETHTFTAPQPGPRLLVLGGIHGNETCGTEAIRQLMAHLQDGTIALTRGTLVCAPLCNPLAHAANVRYVTHNLNRIMHPHPTPTCPEETFAHAVCQLIADCDYVLDLHSFHTPGVPFAFRDYADPATVAFTAALGVPYTLTGWPELYAATPTASGGDTIGYAHSLGKVGATVECGAHTDPAAIALARQCLLGALGHLNMLASAPLPDAPPRTTVRFTGVTLRPEGGTLTRAWKNLDPIRTGDVIATLADGAPLRAPHDGFLLMPHHDAAVGDEWFYVGEQA